LLLSVEKLCAVSGKAVDKTTAEKNIPFTPLGCPATEHCGCALRAAFRLIGTAWRLRSTPFPLFYFQSRLDVLVHCFDETIGGRDYQIEVTLVRDRWRAQIRRGPGMPTALMPFYGQTPNEAAQRLSHWLTLAHSAASTT
jgi:hypothetical protein